MPHQCVCSYMSARRSQMLLSHTESLIRLASSIQPVSECSQCMQHTDRSEHTKIGSFSVTDLANYFPTKITLNLEYSSLLALSLLAHLLWVTKSVET